MVLTIPHSLPDTIPPATCMPEMLLSSTTAPTAPAAAQPFNSPGNCRGCFYTQRSPQGTMGKGGLPGGGRGAAAAALLAPTGASSPGMSPG